VATNNVHFAWSCNYEVPVGRRMGMEQRRQTQVTRD
jgi:hypothetical protein